MCATACCVCVCGGFGGWGVKGEGCNINMGEDGGIQELSSPVISPCQLIGNFHVISEVDHSYDYDCI